jgi:bacterioferritin-associated ferredoxin
VTTILMMLLLYVLEHTAANQQCGSCDALMRSVEDAAMTIILLLVLY